MRVLLRPWCWVFGHRAVSAPTIRGPMLRCRRCRAVLGSPQISGGPLRRR